MRSASDAEILATFLLYATVSCVCRVFYSLLLPPVFKETLLVRRI